MKIMRTGFAILFIISSPAAFSKYQPWGDIQTATADITFKEANVLTFKITPVTDLTAGKKANHTPIASYSVTAQKSAYLGVRWTPGSGIVGGNPLDQTIKLTGKNNEKNTLTLEIEPGEISQVIEGGWQIENYTKNAIHGTVKIAGAQDVPADTYTLSMDASVFTL